MSTLTDRNGTIFSIAGSTSYVWPNFVSAQLAGANLENAILSNANFTDANLQGANLNNVDFQYSNLTRANLQNLNITSLLLLDHAILSYTNLSGSTILTLCIEFVQANHINMSNVNIFGFFGDQSNFEFGNFQNAVIFGLNAENSNFQSTSFNNVNIVSGNINQSNFASSDFNGLTGTILSGSPVLPSFYFMENETIIYRYSDPRGNKIRYVPPVPFPFARNPRAFITNAFENRFRMPGFYYISS